ncbi:MAG: sigma-70 family RNA polymerase sigma factor [Chloroflexi bacterium]|nr:sigma-70 family RNA polymerase sigma factor [Chloroflexota bacterium]MCL5276049.1 sigma-70 family RNA polymerase sigma factor [Chloroflexota bacterium]
MATVTWNPASLRQADLTKEKPVVNEDIQLLDQARTLDPAALGRIYDAYFVRLYRYVYHYVDSAETAQDVASETLRRLLETLHAGHAPDRLSAWLYRVAHNLAIDSIRRNPPGMVIPLDDHGHADDATTESMTEAQMERERVRKALSRLTPEQQNVVILKFLEGHSNVEIGLLINRPEGAVKSLQHRALATLRRILGDLEGAARQQG